MKTKYIILCCFIALKFLLQYILLSSYYDLQRDEYLHLDQANHLAWGYLSVPPFTSWTSYLIQILGNSVFWIKFFPALYGVLTLLIVWKTIESLKGNLFSLVLGATGVLLSALLRLNTLYQPNSFDVLCWTALFFFFIKYTQSQNNKWLYFTAIAFSFGFLNKYNIVFQLLGLFPALLITEQRKIFIRPALYLAALLAVLIILPNLAWQYKNNFPVFHHLKELSETQLQNVNPYDFLKSQLLFFIGSLHLLIAAMIGFIYYKPFKQFRFLFYNLLFTLGIFLFFKAKDYYAIGLYPIYLAFGAVFLSDFINKSGRVYLNLVVLAIPLLLFIPIVNIAFPNKTPSYIIQHADQYKKFGMLSWEDGKDHLIPQDYADMLGWKELAHKVDSAYLGLPATTRTLVLCDNYGQAGAINYYSQSGVKADSFNADYINWFDLSKKYDNLIRVKEFGDKRTEFQKTSPHFNEAWIADSISNKFAREYRTTIFVFKGAKGDIRNRIANEIEKRKTWLIK